MFSSFADHRKPRFRHEQATYPEHLQYRVLTADGRVFNSGNPQGDHSRVALVKCFIINACRRIGSSLKSWIRRLAGCIRIPSLTESDSSLFEIPCPSMEEVERLLEDLERAELGFADQESSSFSNNIEICLWAGTMSFRKHHNDLAKAVIRHKHKYSDAVRQVAIMNLAYRTAWYRVREDGMGRHRFPPGTTGRKLPQLKRPSGAKGLKRAGRWDIPADKDIYIPSNGMARRLEDRPTKGDWYYPRPSPLRKEFKI
ncbi:hypothetical protein IWZ01DRAFT_481933 [Phyllosticta capitalensis]